MSDIDSDSTSPSRSQNERKGLNQWQRERERQNKSDIFGEQNSTPQMLSGLQVLNNKFTKLHGASSPQRYQQSSTAVSSAYKPTSTSPSTNNGTDFALPPKLMRKNAPQVQKVDEKVGQKFREEKEEEQKQIVLRNLDESINDRELQVNLHQYGEIDDIQVLPLSPPVAFVTFQKGMAAQIAVDEMDGVYMNGHTIEVKLAQIGEVQQEKLKLQQNRRQSEKTQTARDFGEVPVSEVQEQQVYQAGESNYPAKQSLPMKRRRYDNYSETMEPNVMINQMLPPEQYRMAAEQTFQEGDSINEILRKKTYKEPNANEEVQDRCYRCKQPGHWTKECPFKKYIPGSRDPVMAKQRMINGTSNYNDEYNQRVEESEGRMPRGDWQSKPNRRREHSPIDMRSAGPMPPQQYQRQPYNRFSGCQGNSFGARNLHNKSDQPRTEFTCFKCNLSGHYAKNCPNSSGKQ